LIRGHAITHVVLLGHDGCGYYKSRFKYESPEAMQRRQLSDLRQAASWVRGAHEGLSVATYFAAPEGDRLRFDEV
jgi:carbonic anhydrase